MIGPADPLVWDNAADITEVAAFFRDNDLSIPFMPLDLARRLVETSPGVFSSDPRLTSLYDLTGWLDWWRRTPRESRRLLAYGNVGYGSCSNRLQCSFAGPALSFALEIPFGNINVDADAELRHARRLLAQAARLYAASRGGMSLPGRPDEEWVLVVPAMITRAEWRTRTNEGEWSTLDAGGDPLYTALDALSPS